MNLKSMKPDVRACQRIATTLLAMSSLLALASGCAKDGMKGSSGGGGRRDARDLSNPPQMMSREQSPATVEAAATSTKAAIPAAMEQFKSLVRAGQAVQFGFASEKQAMAATPGEPTTVIHVRLDDLTSYDGGDPTPLLHAGSPSTIVPLMVDRSAKAMITFARGSDGAYKAVSFGNNPVGKLAFSRPADAGSYIVTVRALNVAFIAKGTGREARFTALNDAPELNMKAGEAMSAVEAFRRLVEPARKSNRQPG